MPSRPERRCAVTSSPPDADVLHRANRAPEPASASRPMAAAHGTGLRAHHRQAPRVRRRISQSIPPRTPSPACNPHQPREALVPASPAIDDCPAAARRSPPIFAPTPRSDPPTCIQRTQTDVRLLVLRMARHDRGTVRTSARVAQSHCFARAKTTAQLRSVDCRHGRIAQNRRPRNLVTAPLSCSARSARRAQHFLADHFVLAPPRAPSSAARSPAHPRSGSRSGS